MDEDRRVFLARGDASGPLERVLLDDPELASDPRAWVTTPREVPRVAGLTESSPGHRRGRRGRGDLAHDRGPRGPRVPLAPVGRGPSRAVRAPS
ncbi:MAG: hypothetical protein M5U28_10540 [Sandaracinaceae bacterium]|nr:hypothetical protein [Sandaracinaceae bacterium]